MILGGFLFFSASIGGALAWIFSRLFQHTTHGLSLLCGGFLVGLLVVDVIPSSFQLYQSLGLLLGILLGYLMFEVLNSLFHTSHTQNPSVSLLAIAIIIHTIPMSLTIGQLLGNAALSITLTASIILHHLPEGFALSTALLSQGERLWRLFIYFIAFSIFFSTFIQIGQYWELSDKAQGVLMGVSIGLIATASISEFILHHIRSVTLKSLIAYVLLGYLLSHVFHMLVE
ncbi:MULTISPECIES: ZIP family metal transporter [unclassified Lysinibacillus]|uniref:ZIP family metal transporter n=1 Tax=unclassified Lysinibacillus TaxID=2636778 RepID=UPI0020134693|nr:MULTISPECIES: ZIP family metal transporter [unclassified Lysinibacillus]MCL1697373.1 ZIP family metal transporter [Lysinibacillus sp. BPa_S21]MCL1702167.1 ZIP family metal transporter [Lysinibacillus sp. Bpr_S20]